MKMLMRILGQVALLASLLLTPNAFAAEKITYFHHDAQGSIVAATDEQGSVIWRETYQPYGERVRNEPAAANNTRWYTGHPQDSETGLIYAGARYYDPAIGRFMGVDPTSFIETNPHSFNRYIYGNNNPYKYIDPDGRAGVEFQPGGSVKCMAEGACLPGGGAGAGGAAMQRSLPQTTASPGPQAGKPIEITIDKGRYPESARHVEDAVRAGKPDTLTLDRAGAAERRRDALRGSERSPGLDRDEYPPAMFKEGGGGASVRPMNPGDNRGAGACVGAQCRNLPEGAQIKIKIAE